MLSVSSTSGRGKPLLLLPAAAQAADPPPSRSRPPRGDRHPRGGEAGSTSGSTSGSTRGSTSGSRGGQKQSLEPDASTVFWDTGRAQWERCAPRRLGDVVGNRKDLERLSAMLAARHTHKGPGVNVLLQAAPGVGSTVALRCVAAERGLEHTPINNAGAGLGSHIRTIDAMLNSANRSKKRRMVVVELSEFAVTTGDEGGDGATSRPRDEGFGSFVRLAAREHVHHLVVVATKQWCKRIATLSKHPAFERIQMRALTITELRHVALRVLSLAGLTGCSRTAPHPRTTAILGSKSQLECADEWAERVALQSQGSARKASQIACSLVDQMGEGYADLAPPAPARTDTEDGQKALLMHRLANRDRFSVWAVATSWSAEDVARATAARQQGPGSRGARQPSLTMMI